MQVHRQTLVLHTPGRQAFVNLTDEVARCVGASGVGEGVCLVQSLHNTASILVTEDEPGLLRDLEAALEGWVPGRPSGGGYRYHLTGEENAAAHLRRLLAGRGALLSVTGGRLELGPMEQVLYAEFDGQRDKRVLLKVLGAPAGEVSGGR